MDLKEYAGKDVIVQFKPGHGWYVFAAPLKSAQSKLPELIAKSDGKGNSMPAVVPFLQGHVTPTGHVVVNTGNGGKLLVEVDPDSIFCVDSVLESAEEQLVKPATSSLIMP